MRQLVLVVVLAFLAVLAALTIDDIVVNGVSPLDVVAFLILGLFGFGIVGALWHPHRADPLETARVARRETTPPTDAAPPAPGGTAGAIRPPSPSPAADRTRPR